MKKLQILCIILLGIISFSACEKDDICVDGDTPLLVINFYDKDDTTNLKQVTKLRIVGANKEFPYQNANFMDRTDVDVVDIPLIANETSTTFALIQNSADVEEAETGNIDVVTFNYTTKEVFVSRACGFIINYENLTQELTADTDNWIQEVKIEETLIEKSDIVHVKIFH